MSERPERCGYVVEHGLYAPLTCGRDKGHTGTHIDFRANGSIGFGHDPTIGNFVLRGFDAPAEEESA